MDSLPKKKIVFIINNFLIGGVERLLLDMLRSVDLRSRETHIITVWGTGSLETEFKKLGISVHFAAGRLAYSPQNPLLKLYFTIISPVTLVRLWLMLLKIRPDVVITGLVQGDILGGMAAKLAEVNERVIWQTDTSHLEPWIKYVKQICSVNFATRAIAINHAVEQFLVDYFHMSANKISVIHGGINMHIFNSVDVPHHLDKNIVLGFLGRLESVKGPTIFLEALNHLKEQYHLLPKTIIIGDGSLRSNLENYAVSHRLSNIQFIGATSTPASALELIDVLVIPSLSEGFCLVALEGLITRKIVVASDIPMLHDLITHNQNGLFFISQNSWSLAEQLKSILQDGELREHLQIGINEWVGHHQSEFDIHHVAEKYLSTLESVGFDS